MRFNNSYIFLKRKKEEKEHIKEDNNIIVVSLSPSFKNLLKKAFKNISFDYKNDEFDFMNSGTIKINNKKINVSFKYHNVWSSYYLEIMVKSNNKKDAIDVLEYVNSILIGKQNIFDKYFVSIVSYDYISEYYCNKLFPYLNKFERKLRKILFNVYTLNFNLEYYSATTNKDFQNELKQKSNITKDESISKQDCYIKLGFYSLDYNDIDKLLFTKTITKNEEQKIQTFLTENEDLTKLSDSKIREAFILCSNKTDWERFFGNKKFNVNFQQVLNDIRNFRNNIAHCKFISKTQYINCKNILKETIKSLNVAIKITEEQDFINKNIELQNESFDRLTKIMQEIVSNTLDISTLIQPLQNLKETINPFKSLISNTPNIVLPEIELPKYNIPIY